MTSPAPVQARAPTLLHRFRRSLRLVFALAVAGAAAARELRVEIAAEHSSVFQVYFGHSAFDFSEPESVKQDFTGDGQFHELSFAIPDWEPLTLRLDPTMVPGMVRLRR